MLQTAQGARRLTHQEAEAIWRAWAERRDESARDRLVLAYAPMVRYLATRKVRELPAHCELDDLVSCGLIALMEAVERFDPSRGASFEQYAWTRASGAIMDELRRQDWASRSVRRTGREIDRARDAFFAREGRLPTDAELAGSVGMEPARLRVALDEVSRAELVSLSAPAPGGGDDGQPVEIGDTLRAGGAGCEPEEAVLRSERSAALKAAVEALSPREREILALVHVHEVPGAEIGRMLGISESRVSQILSGVRKKLREALDRYEAPETVAA